MHEQWQDMLPLYVNGTLNANSREALDNHLTDCAECRAALGEWQHLAEAAITEVEALRAALPPLALPGTNRFAPYPLNSSPLRQRHSWEDNAMFSSRVMSLPAQPRRMNIPLPLVAALILTLLVTSLLIFNTAPDVSVPLGAPQLRPVDVFQRYINEAWNAGNLDVLDDLLTADHACYEPGLMEGVLGVEHVAAMIGNYRTAFPDWQFTVEDLVVSDNQVWARLVGTGTHTGPFAYTGGAILEATDNPVNIEMMVSAHLAGGKITEQRFQFDLLGLLEQLQGGSIVNTYLTQLRTLEQANQLEGWNQHDINMLREALHSPFFTYAWGIDNDGIGAASASNTERTMTEGLPGMLFNSFPDLELTPVNVMAAGDTSILEVRARGTFENDLVNLRDNGTVVPATHQIESWSWLFINQFDSEGRILLNRQYWDGFPESIPVEAVHEARNMELVQQYTEVWNQHDGGALRAFYNEPYYSVSFGIDRVRNFQSSPQEGLEALWDVFPDLQATIVNMEAVGDTVIVETRMRGTFENDVRGWVIPDADATHKVETWSWLDIFRFNNEGKIVEWRIYLDGFPGQK